VIVVETSVLMWNNTEGLCGTLNSNPDDDMTTKEGARAKTTAVMASSWQMNTIQGTFIEKRGSPTVYETPVPLSSLT
jgi:hypothetical protein